jgi:hypothetical protein
MHCVFQVSVTSEPHEVTPDPPEAGSIAAMATDQSNGMELPSASVHLAKAPCKYVCANSSSTDSTLKYLFSYHSFASKLQESYGKKNYIHNLNFMCVRNY